MFCNSCGAQLRDGAKFCGSCGATIEPKASAPPAASMPPPRQPPARPSSDAPTSPPSPTPRPAPEPPPAPASPPAQAPHRPVPAPATSAHESPSAREATERRDIETAPAESNSRSRTPLIAGIATLLVLAIAGGGFAYWKGFVGNRQGSVAQSIQQQLATAGVADAAVVVDKAWIATLSGNVTGRDAHDKVLATVRANGDIKGVVDQLVVLPSVAELQVSIDTAIRRTGLRNAQATVAEGGQVTLAGTVDSEDQRARANSAVRTVQGVVEVIDQLSPSLTWRQADLNRVLAEQGFTRVRARFVSETEVELTGTVESAEDTQRLGDVVTANVSGATLRMNVVEQPRPTVPAARQAPMTAAATPSAAAAPPPPRNAAMRGVWIGNVTVAIVGYTVNLRLDDVAVGEVAGTSLYGGNRKAICEGRLTLTAISPEVAEYTEEISRKGLFCPAGGTVKVHLQGPRSAFVEWYRAKTPDRVAMKAQFTRQ